MTKGGYEVWDQENPETQEKPTGVAKSIMQWSCALFIYGR